MPRHRIASASTLSVVCLTTLLAACTDGTSGHAATPPPIPDEVAPIAQVEEAFLTLPQRSDEIDSVAVWTHPDGSTWLIATAKASQRLVVYDGDSGERLQDVGGFGPEPGRFNRPNGVAVHEGLVFVAERDNRRVQILRLPDFEAVGSFGEADLVSPYGLWLHPVDADTLEVYVTDSYLADVKTLQVPPLEELDRRIKHYRLQLDGQAPQAELVGMFGDTTEAGALRMVESIAGDPLHDRLLIAEEDLRVGTTLREYTLSGHYTGRSLPPEHFAAQAEGVALWACPDGSGYWIAVDQHGDLARFLVFDRADLRHLGTFTGLQTAATDGVAVHQAATARFPHGALYAAHDDEGVAAFDWGDIARALGLRERCEG